MPPPPPPSASYTWKFDSATDDESSEGDEDAIVSKLQANLTLDAFAGDDEEAENHGQLEDWIASSSSSSNNKKGGKRKKNKKKNRRKKKKAAVVKKFCFGTVRIQEYERCLGVDTVPLDGSWPLGIGEKIPTCPIAEITVDEYETHKQERLLARLSKLQIDEELAERLQVHDTLETRQWDFRSNAKNPLFRLIMEEDRMQLLLDYCEPDLHGDSPTSTKRKSTRSPNYNDIFTKADVSHFRTELEDIRARRCIQDATGCSCHRLKVYIPPEHAGKTAQKKRLAMNKVKSELRKRNLLPEDEHSLSREDLEKMLHDVVENEGCCNFDCPCSENGIGCQSDACDCWKSKDNTTESIQARCGNPIGMYTVDPDAIDNYRRNVLHKLTVCPPVAD